MGRFRLIITVRDRKESKKSMRYKTLKDWLAFFQCVCMANRVVLKEAISSAT